MWIIGIVCPIGLLQPAILNYLKRDLISIGNIRMLFMIFERKFKELEVVVKFKSLTTYFIVLF